MLTGLDVQENQARRLLADMACFRAAKQHAEGRQLPESVTAFRWLHEAFEQPTVARVPPELRSKLEPAEVYHEVLEHRWLRSEERGAELDLA